MPIPTPAPLVETPSFTPAGRARMDGIYRTIKEVIDQLVEKGQAEHGPQYTAEDLLAEIKAARRARGEQ
jgi:polyhydroxyalkanoate synthesis regulator phasin